MFMFNNDLTKKKILYPGTVSTFPNMYPKTLKDITEELLKF